MDNISFQAKARTVDHLGREQIADCPTAISELWKNSFDAYATQVTLDLFSGQPDVAVLSDDGHGMNKDEFISKWLVVGTEAKATGQSVPSKDRNGLRQRPRQGQKGIGRLSCANLGPTLLLISKRKDSPFVVSLIDWRLFENPFLNLADVQLPVMEFERKEDIFGSLPKMAESVLSNLKDDTNKDRSKRLETAWRENDSLIELASGIRTSLEGIVFDPNHLKEWSVWSGQSEHGTAMLVSGLNFDLTVQIQTDERDVSALAARERFFETLSSFVDPFLFEGASSVLAKDPQFEYAVRVWRELVPHTIVGPTKEFDRTAISDLEHQIDGIVDAQGVFTGRVKAFGSWLDGECKIYPPNDLSIPVRSDTLVGPFSLFIASLEFNQSNSTHSPAELSRYKDLADRYAGFMVFRDGLRVLPYGRTDNDYFKIDDRRSRHAGREFWNNRQMFGRVAVGKISNPNLKDKAGREGLIDNRAAKVLRELVSHILKDAARKYFGTESPIRKSQLPDIRKSNAERKAAIEREKLKKRNTREFRGKLKQYSLELPELQNEVSIFAEELVVNTDSDIASAQDMLEGYRERLSDFALSGAPKKLGALSAKYDDYRSSFRITRDLIGETTDKLAKRIEELSPQDPVEIISKQIERGSRAYASSLGKKKEEIFKLQQTERSRVTDLFEANKQKFAEEAEPVLQRLKAGQIDLAKATKQLDELREHLKGFVDELFNPYKNALETLQDNIDLDHIIRFGLDEVEDLRGERDRLTNLAQLGIAVEISGHELQDYDDLIAGALSRLPEDIRQLTAVRDIELGVEGLTDQLRFLSPLRLAGQRVKSTISGSDIYGYIKAFFALQLSQRNVKFHATSAFLGMSIFDLKSRLFPVFINLINNSLYWVSNAKTDERSIILDVVGDEVVISDSGPGVDPDDVDSLFTLFFTRKARGGRGVGLYLAKANLSAAGHSIRYEAGSSNLPLHGANFLIKLEGAEFD